MDACFDISGVERSEMESSLCHIYISLTRFENEAFELIISASQECARVRIHLAILRRERKVASMTRCTSRFKTSSKGLFAAFNGPGLASIMVCMNHISIVSLISQMMVA